MDQTDITKQRVETALGRYPRLQPMIEAEPKVLEVLQIAASQTNQAERWELYSILKKVATTYVGWYSKEPLLQSSACYQTIIEAIDLVLPPPQIENVTSDDVLRQRMLQQLRDAILQTCPEAKAVAERIILE